MDRSYNICYKIVEKFDSGQFIKKIINILFVHKQAREAIITLS